MFNLFRKSEARTLKEAGDLVAAGWSPDLPVRIDAGGNITARCAATALASVPRANPGAWARLTRELQAIGLTGLLPMDNKHPDMTQAKMVAVFRRAEDAARAA